MDTSWEKKSAAQDNQPVLRSKSKTLFKFCLFKILHFFQFSISL